MSRFYFLIFAFVCFVSVRSVPVNNDKFSNYHEIINSEVPWRLKRTTFEESYEKNVETDVQHPVSWVRFARSVSKNAKNRWPSPIIPFEINPNMSSKRVKIIDRVIRHYENRTCLKFKPKSDQDQDYVYFDNRPSGCFSEFTGRKGGRQVVNLDEKYCLNTSEPTIHEIFHVLGFNHEHTRPDRDDYITIHWENINPAMNNSFTKEKQEDVDNLGLPYDYRSIVHVHEFGGSINGKATVSAKVPNQTVGSKGRLSELDVLKIAILFNCNDLSSTTNTPQTEVSTTKKPQTGSTTTIKPQTTSTTTNTPQTESTTTTTKKPQTTSTTTKKPQTTSTITEKPQTTSTTTKNPQTKITTTKNPVTTTQKRESKESDCISFYFCFGSVGSFLTNLVISAWNWLSGFWQ